MCVGLDALSVLGVWRSVRRSRQGRERGEKGVKRVRRKVIVESGRGMVWDLGGRGGVNFLFDLERGGVGFDSRLFLCMFELDWIENVYLVEIGSN